MSEPSLIILAAGFSRRFGEDDKLFADLGGETLLSRTLSLYPADLFNERKLVIKPDDAAALELANAHGFEGVLNESAANGMGTSIAAGVRSLQAKTGVMIALADMPFVKPITIKSLVSAFEAASGAAIIAPNYDNKIGHPKVFSSDFFDELIHLDDDEGGRSLVAHHQGCLTCIQVEDEGVIRDVDTIDDIPDTP